MTTFAESGKPYTVLRLPPIRYAKDIWDEFAEKNKNVVIVETSATNRKEFVEQLEGGQYADVDFIARTFQSVKETGLFDRELLTIISKHTAVKGIAHCGAGYDQVDANVCKELGIQLSNVPGRVNDSTADTNVFLILSTLRNFQLGHNNLMQGHWKKDMNSAGTIYGHCIQNKVIGILGMGGIGQTIRDRLAGFGVKKVVYYNRSRLAPELEKGAEYCATIEELAVQSDVISINIPLNEETFHVVNEALIAQMKDGVVIVNTARGPVVDERAVKKGLLSGKIFGYGTDVFENEPDIDMAFASLPNVTSLPHMGTATVETIRSMEALVVENVEAFYRTGRVKTLVSELQGDF